jgi:hypothetical protein
LQFILIASYCFAFISQREFLLHAGLMIDLQALEGFASRKTADGVRQAWSG